LEINPQKNIQYGVYLYIILVVYIVIEIRLEMIFMSNYNFKLLLFSLMNYGREKLKFVYNNCVSILYSL